MSVQQDQPRHLYGATDAPDQQREALVSSAVPVAVYGLGKMGLPLAAVFADVTGNVIGVDIDQTVVDQVNDGECPIDHEPQLPALVSSVVESGALRATAGTEQAARQASVHVVIVPTTLTDEDEPDLSALATVTEAIGDGLSAGDVVLVESTVPPGTCREVVLPTLSAASGLDRGQFGVAFCPERTASGRAIEDIRGSYPKIIGGVDAESTRVASLLYGEITANDIVSVADATTAEAVKVFEGVYRDVNIALANELARLSDELGIAAVEAIDAANTQPYCDIHEPGIGVGGHCIPYYPHFLRAPFETEVPLLETARAVNESMPAFATDELVERLDARGITPDEATVLVLGLAYRPGVPETRASPAWPVIDRLVTAGSDVLAVDPVVDQESVSDVPTVAVDEIPALDPDAAVLVTAHEEFGAIDWDRLDDLVVIDGRRALDLDGTTHDRYAIGGGAGV